MLRLVSKGWVLDALSSEAGRPPGSGHGPSRAHQLPDEGATFMGVWKGPSSPVHRRIDIKIHPWPAVAYALHVSNR